MNSPLALYVLIPALCWVIASDLLYRRIHNLLVVVLLLVWCALPVFGLLGLGPWAGLGAAQVFNTVGGALLGGLLVLAVGFVLFNLGQVGAGDVKLMAVLCLWSCGDNQTAFLIVTALAGGILALSMPLLNLFEQAAARLWLRLSTHLPRLGIPIPTVLTADRPQGLPYGLAIAAGSFYTLLFPIHS